MKKFFLMLAILMVSCAWVSAQNFTFGEDDSYSLNSTATVDGTYAGKAYPRQMGGHWVPPIPLSCTFTIQDGILNGSLTVPVIGHSFKLYTTEEITGPGVYQIEGTFTKNNGVQSTISGNVNISAVNGSVLNFKCTAILDGDTTKTSIFDFYSTNQ